MQKIRRVHPLTNARTLVLVVIIAVTISTCVLSQNFSQPSVDLRRNLATCPSGVGTTEFQKRSVWTYSGFTSCRCKGARMGASGAIYTVDASINEGGTPGVGCTIFSKISSDFLSSPWSKKITYYTWEDTISLSNDESRLYVGVAGVTDTLVALDTTNGAVAQALDLNGILTGARPFIEISSDDTTIYITSFQTQNTNPTVCKFDINILTGDCYLFPDLNQIYGFKLDTSHKVYFYGLNAAAPNNMRYIKFDSSSNTVLWNNEAPCAAASCTSSYATFGLNSAGTLVYSLNDITDSGSYVIMNAFDVTTGAISGNRYITNTACNLPEEVSAYNSKIYGTFGCGSNYIIIEFDEATQTLTQIYQSSLQFTNNIGGSTGSKLQLTGQNTSGEKCVIFTTSTTSISEHLDFTTSTVGMDILPSGNREPALVTISPPGTLACNPASTTFTLTTDTYVYDSAGSYTNDAYYRTDTQTIDTLVNNTAFTVMPELTCSSTGLTTITYSLAAYGADPIPSWVALNPSTGELTGTAPDVTVNTTYGFYINSDATEFVSTKQKLVYLGVVVPVVIPPTPTPTPTPVVTPEPVVEAIISQETETSTTTTQAASAVGVCAGVAASSMNASSPTSVWSLMNQLQLLILFLLIDTFIPEDVQSYIEGQDFALVNFSFLNTGKIPVVKIPLDWMDFEQPNERLVTLGLESRSTFNNSFSQIIIVVVIVFVHASIKLSPSCKPSNDRNPSKCQRLWGLMRKKILDVFMYMVYVRYILEANQNLLFASMSELDEFDISDLPYIISLVIAVVVLLFCLFMVGVSFYYFVKFYNGYDPNQKFFLMEFYADIKNKRWARFYTPMLLTRRLMFVVIIIILGFSGRTVVFSVLTVTQIAYLTAIILIRPFEEAADNLVEILNEVFYFGFIILMFCLDSESKWTSTMTRMFISLMTANTMVIALIMIITLVLTASSCLYKKYRKRTRVDPAPRELGDTLRVMVEEDKVNHNKEIPTMYEDAHPSDQRMNRTLSNKTPQHHDLQIEDIDGCL